MSKVSKPASHALIYWEQEKSYSTVNVSHVIYDVEKNPNPHDLVGQLFRISWGDDIHIGQVTAVGSKKAMQREESYFANCAAEISFNEKELIEEGLEIPKSPKRPINSPDFLGVRSKEEIATKLKVKKSKISPEAAMVVELLKKQSNIEDMGSASLPLVNCDNTMIVLRSDGTNEDGNLSSRTQTESKDDMIRKLERKLCNAKAEIKKLKGRNVYPEEFENGEKYEFGNGIFAPRLLVEDLTKQFKSKPGILLRKLMLDTKLFTVEQIADCSISGKKSRFSPEAKPKLGSMFLTLKDYVMTKCQLEGTPQMKIFEISVSSICTDARKQLKRAHATELAKIVNERINKI